MKKRVSKNTISLARTLGVAGLLAVTLVTTSGCIQREQEIFLQTCFFMIVQSVFDP